MTHSYYYFIKVLAKCVTFQGRETILRRLHYSSVSSKGEEECLNKFINIDVVTY